MFNGVQQCIETTPALQYTLPVSRQPLQCLLLDGLHFAAETGERFAADLAQHFDIAPLAVDAAGAESSFHDAAIQQQHIQYAFDLLGIQGKAQGNFAQGEGPVGSSEAAKQFQHRRLDRLQQRSRDSWRKGDAQGVTIARRILYRNQAPFSGYFDIQQAPAAEQPIYFVDEPGISEAALEFLARKITDAQQQIVNAVRRSNALGFEQALELLFHLVDGIGIEQLAQVGVSQQVA